MKRYWLTCVIILIAFNMAMGQSNDVLDNQNRSCWATIDRSINKYVDSLNFIKNKSDLPLFLEDYLYDWKYKDRLYPCTKNPQEKVSFRKSIIDRVVREDILGWIVNSENTAYDKCYIPDRLKEEMGKDARFESFPTLPYMTKSWRDLAMMRLEEISRKKRLY